MTSPELHHAGARAPDESSTTVKRIGFLLADPSIPVADPDDERFGPRVIDWDEFQQIPSSWKTAETKCRV